MNERESLLKKIMAYSFAAYDWVLYLNTHPNDAMALEMFKNMNKKATALKAQYIEKYGPLSHSDVDATDGWTWVQDPWPWN